MPVISVAPMMDCTDRHDRYFLRLIAPHVLLYTEMISTAALIQGDRDYLLKFDPREKYLALQLGGSNPNELAYCAKLGEEYGYDEINLNVGCPSSRVKKGEFGACLMKNPKLVAECVASMQAKIKIPVSVKCRIGVDDQDSYELLHTFIAGIASAGCKIVIIHARKAWLSGLSPKENREIPPLNYQVVRQIKKDFPQLTVILNGGIKSIEDIASELQFVDGVMIGREAYSNPYFLAEVEERFFSTKNILSRHNVIAHFIPYINEQLNFGVKLSLMTRHILGLFKAQVGGAVWRRYLSENAYKSSSIATVKNALDLMDKKQQPFTGS